MSIKQKNVPRLRFPGFTDAWERQSVKDSFLFIQNNTLSRAELSMNNGCAKNIHYGDILVKFGEYLEVSKTDLPYIKAQRILEKYRSSLLRDGDIIMADTAEDETVGKCTEIAELHGSQAISGLHTIPMRPKANFASGYLGYYMNSKAYHDQLFPLMQGIKVTSVSKSAIQGTNISFPRSVAEQDAIGKCFIRIDTLITLQQRKLDQIKEYKKGMLQKMFPKDGESVPEVRFPGFSGEWVRKKLGSICKRVVRKNKNNESELPLTISSQYGLVDQRNFFNKVVAAKDMSNYYLLKRGEFAYNKSYSTGFDYGSIKRLNIYEQGCLSTLYICFALTATDVDSDYLECYFDTLQWYGAVSQICAEGARNHGLLNVETKAFFDDVSVTLPPTKAEQLLISSYLNNLDNLITLHQRKLDAMKEYKKGLLQQMFV